MRHHSSLEAWLLAAVELMRPIFLAKNNTTPRDVLIACGFASTGTRMGDWNDQ